MKTLVTSFALLFILNNALATIHEVHVWDGYFQFVDIDNSFSNNVDVQLGDTVQWLPLDAPMMAHTITSSNLPVGAATFDYLWQAPADTFFQYVPTVSGLHEYVCTPHELSHNMVGTINVMPVGSVTEVGALNLKIFPNPTMDQLELEDNLSNTRYTILNSKGIPCDEGMLTKKLNVADLPSGIYYLRLEGDLPRTTKFIKQ